MRSWAEPVSAVLVVGFVSASLSNRLLPASEAICSSQCCFAREEANRFIDDNFGQLDLSGCPSLLTPPSEESQLPDASFAPLDDRGTGLGSAALKESIEQLASDPEVQAQMARETGNPELLEAYQERQAEQASPEFMRRNPAYY